MKIGAGYLCWAGRKKTRPSNLIRVLYRSGMICRAIAKVTKCSQGAVGKEIKELKKEQEEKKDPNEINSVQVSDIPEIERISLEERGSVSKEPSLEMIRY